MGGKGGVKAFPSPMTIDCIIMSSNSIQRVARGVV